MVSKVDDNNDKDDKGSAGSSAKQWSLAGSSGEEADIETSSGGSGSGERASRRLHKTRAAVVCQDGHLPPAVHQHEGDCMVASRLLALWTAAPVVGNPMKVGKKQPAAEVGAPVPC